MKLSLLAFIALALTLTLYIVNANFETEVSTETPLGRIVGIKRGKVVSYLGVPFAEPPIGYFRFRPPRSKRPWAPNTYYATRYSAECLQSALYSLSDGRGERDEDCLYLNIWVPANYNPKNGPLPVLLWIYGGAFLQGAASKPEYVGDKLADRGVIVVSCNYRLGALGFLVSTQDGLYGNYGLSDQKLAMQWVQDNIESFGGDPSRVTLFGESAGAMSIGLHFLDQEVPKKPKLFHAIILQSNPFGYKYRSITVANFLGESFKSQLDCEDLRCLQSEPADEILHVQDTLLAVPRSIGDFFTWGPVITDDAQYRREVRQNPPGSLSNITVMQPMRALQEIFRSDVPVILGTNSNEGAVFIYTAVPARVNRVFYETSLFGFFRGYNQQINKLYRQSLLRVEKSPNPDYREVLAEIIGDYLFRCPNYHAASLLHTVGSAQY